MFERVYEVLVPASLADVWSFHSSVAALKILTPPERQAEIIGDDLEVREGALHIVRTRQFGIPMEWRARIVVAEPPNRFVDVAEKGPFSSWWHEHAFIEQPGGTLIRDTLRYQPPGGILAPIVNALYVRGQLDALFAFRHRATLKHFESWVADAS